MLPEAHQGIASKDARSALLVIPSSRVFSCATAAISPFIILCGRYNAITVTVSFLQILGFFAPRVRNGPNAQAFELQSLETDLPPKLFISLQCTKTGLLGTGKAEPGEQEDKTFYVEYF